MINYTPIMLDFISNIITAPCEIDWDDIDCPESKAKQYLENNYCEKNCKEGCYKKCWLEYLKRLEEIKMEQTEKVNFVGDVRDFEDLMSMGLRYALNRQSYVTSYIPNIIMNNNHHISSRICDVMLVDLIHYFNDRKTLGIKDDECDYNSWKMLYEYLLNIKEERNYQTPNHEYWKLQFKENEEEKQ